MKPGKNSGSRYSDGSVPNVNFNSDNGKVNVNWYNPGNANPNLRSRQEVSEQRNPEIIGISSINFDFYCFKYFIQPLAILEISCRLNSSSMYVFWLIISEISNSFSNPVDNFPQRERKNYR